MSDDKEIRIDVEDGSKKKEKNEEPVSKSDAAKEQKEQEESNPSNESVEEQEQIEKEKEEKTEEEQLREKLIISEEKLLLAMADFENYKKRLARRQEEFYRTANDSLLTKLLDVVDNFERAIAHAGEAGSEANTKAGLIDGTIMILKQLQDILNHYQVLPLDDAVGQPFDPNLHEALMQIESDEHDEGIISVEIARGYKVGDRILRHSKVGVSKGKPKAEPKDAPETDSSKNQKTD